MSSNRETLLCHYHYDPLDRLADCTLPVTEEASIQRFYQKDRLATEVQGMVQRSIMQYEDQLLAQQQRQTGTVATRLLATDQQRSVLNVLDAIRPNSLAYTAYGHRPSANGLLSLLGFNGERPDTVTGCYLLGNGYRAFNPVLMRFNSSDSWSPFGEGGLNTYAYCDGDSVNQRDPTGHAGIIGMFKFIGRKLRLRDSSYVKIKPNSPVSLPVSNIPPPLPKRNLPVDPYDIGPSASVRGRNPNSAQITPDPILRELPRQHPKLAAGQWSGSAHNRPDEQLANSVQIPRPGAVLHTEERLAVQAQGLALESARMKMFPGDYQPVGYMNKKGAMFMKWERTKIRRS